MELETNFNQKKSASQLVLLKLFPESKDEASACVLFTYIPFTSWEGQNLNSCPDRQEQLIIIVVPTVRCFTEMALVHPGC